MKNTKIKIFSAVTTAGVVLSPVIALADGEGLPDAGGLKTWILGLVGTLLIAFIAVSVFKDFVQQKWGAMVATIIGGSLVAWICYFPDSFIKVLKAFVTAMGG